MEDRAAPAAEGTPVTRFECADVAVIANGLAHWFMARPPLEQRRAALKATA